MDEDAKKQGLIESDDLYSLSTLWITEPEPLPEIMQGVSLLSQTPEHFRALLEGAAAYERRFGTRVAEGVSPDISSSGEKISEVRGVTRYG